MACPPCCPPAAGVHQTLPLPAAVATKLPTAQGMSWRRLHSQRRQRRSGWLHTRAPRDGRARTSRGPATAPPEERRGWRAPEAAERATQAPSSLGLNGSAWTRRVGQQPCAGAPGSVWLPSARYLPSSVRHRPPGGSLRPWRLGDQQVPCSPSSLQAVRSVRTDPRAWARSAASRSARARPCSTLTLVGQRW